MNVFPSSNRVECYLFSIDVLKSKCDDSVDVCGCLFVSIQKIRPLGILDHFFSFEGIEAKALQHAMWQILRYKKFSAL